MRSQLLRATALVGVSSALVAAFVFGSDQTSSARPSTTTAAATTSTTPEKAAAQAAEAKYDEQNATIAADAAQSRSVAASKADADARHLTALAAEPAESSAWPTGIFEDSEAPASGMDFLGTNRWVGQVGAAYLAVYAGTAGDDDPGTGRILAVRSDGQSGYTLDLPGAGALRVVAAEGSTLTVADAKGTSHVLNAERGSWLS